MFARASHVYVVLVLAILIAAAAIRAADPFFVQALRLIAFDSYQKLAPAEFDPQTPVRIVDIDEESLARIGQWPWPRTVIADLLARLYGQGAATVGFDILFSEPDRTSPEEAVKLMSAAEAAAIAPVIAGQMSHDDILAAVIQGTPTVLAEILGQRKNDPVIKSGYAIAGDDPKSYVPTFIGATANLPILDDAAAGVGAINWIPDRDQVVRRVQLVFRVGDKYVPTLMT
jgi:adenylate cyclase